MATFEDVQPGDYLIRIAASRLGRAYKSRALTELGIRAGDVVVDLGCGPGADLAAFAEAAGEGGRVIGVDVDRAALAEASNRVASLPQVRVMQGDVHAVGLPDTGADRVHTDRVLQHVADPTGVLAEVRRVLRPGGSAVFAEPDWDTLVIDYPDPAVPRAYTGYVVDKVVRNSRIGRQLVRLASDAELTVSNVVPITTAFRDVQSADKVLGLKRVSERAVQAGYLTADSAGLFLEHLATRPFFASMTLFIVVAQVEPRP
ncbi:MAG TPA: methyltransferase domain-containing protein [Streptosporangiaceae bacterium]|nr:methyltransferase domain-containing protein [Streptosporangiaceae bacterium]